MKFKFLFSILLSIIVGYLFGQILFNIYNKQVTDVFSEQDKLYFLQQGVYSNKDTMKANTESLSNYIFIKEGNYYKVYAAITSNKDNIEKLKEIFINLGNDIYVVEKSTSSLEYMETIKQYDNLS
jgi:hypothetical protein